MQIETILSLAARKKVIRAADLAEAGITRTLLSYLQKRGMLRRIARGAYVLTDAIPEYGSFLEAAAAVPHGVICLLSALQFHEITTQMPMETWIAVQRGHYTSARTVSSLRIVQFSGAAFSQGIETHGSGGAVIRVYSPAKTIVDCFRFRNRIGLEIAQEALRDGLRHRKATRDDIWKLAGCCHMSNVMRPYLESIE